MFPIDLRSDTVTKPDTAMRKAMSEAEVGDDVYREDPTVHRLEELGASLLGKEAALYVTSGTQGNLVSLLTHCARGDGVIVGKESHIWGYEGGGMAALGGIVPFQVADAEGLPSLEELNYALKPENNVHHAYVKLLCLENTHNRGGGHASSAEEISKRVEWAKKNGIKVHMDGARLFNASAALGVNPSELVKNVDSVQICLSKGLGAPMGSLICASRDFVERARFWRKKVGGGLRQVGVVAAAGVYALSHNINRLAEDHEHAALIKSVLEKEGVTSLEVKRPTNMVYFKTDTPAKAGKLLAACQKRQIFFGQTAPDTFRLVTHMDITREQALKAAEAIVEESRA